MANTPVTTWNAGLYDHKHDFVSRYGEDLVRLLDPQAGERILDLGCGTGTLTAHIAEAGARVTGIDNSPEMIAKAKATYPALDFQVQSATGFHFETPFDAIFSNAVLHWVLEKEKAATCMYENLRPGGRLLLEMGGKDNVAAIINALKAGLQKYGYLKQANVQLWYFPSLGEYTSLLESVGFRINYATHYDRPTPLKDNDNGIKDWLQMFAGAYLSGIPADAVDNILTEVQQRLKPILFNKDVWIADYKRLRVVATRPVNQSLFNY